MGRIFPNAKFVKPYLTASDKRNKFKCLVPIFIGQLDNYRDMSVSDIFLDADVVRVLMEITDCLQKVFAKAECAQEFGLTESSNFNELILCLKVFRAAPIEKATPGELTYINVRLEKLIKVF